MDVFPDPFPNDKFFSFSKLKKFADDKLEFDENSRKVLQMCRKHREKEKLLDTSNFSFSHSVFRRLLLQSHKNQGLRGKG